MKFLGYVNNFEVVFIYRKSLFKVKLFPVTFQEDENRIFRKAHFEVYFIYILMLFLSSCKIYFEYLMFLSKYLLFEFF